MLMGQLFFRAIQIGLSHLHQEILVQASAELPPEERVPEGEEILLPVLRVPQQAIVRHQNPLPSETPFGFRDDSRAKTAVLLF